MGWRVYVWKTNLESSDRISSKDNTTMPPQFESNLYLFILNHNSAILNNTSQNPPHQESILAITIIILAETDPDKTMLLIKETRPVVTITHLESDTRKPHIMEYADETFKQHTPDTHPPIPLSNRDREDLSKTRNLKPHRKTKNIPPALSYKKRIGVQLVKLHIEIGIMLRESLLLNLHNLLEIQRLKTPDNDHKPVLILRSHMNISAATTLVLPDQDLIKEFLTHND